MVLICSQNENRGRTAGAWILLGDANKPGVPKHPAEPLLLGEGGWAALRGRHENCFHICKNHELIKVAWIFIIQVFLLRLSNLNLSVGQKFTKARGKNQQCEVKNLFFSLYENAFLLSISIHFEMKSHFDLKNECL